MKLPRLDPETKQFYDTILPTEGKIETRSMFGGLGSFVNGNMFAGALGTKIFLRLPDADRRALLREPGGGPFEPVKGHAMAEYATVPAGWVGNAERVRPWMAKSLAFAATLPAKKGKKRTR